MADTIELGSLNFNNEAVPVGVTYKGERISFRDTVPGKGISFVKWKDLYVADRCICSNISWDDLNKCGFIFGRPITIGRTSYLCRSLKVGAQDGVPNEWDALLDDLGTSDDLLHWKDRYFWGQETALDWLVQQSVRGYASARYWSHGKASYRDVSVGFRPVFEPLPPEVCFSDALIGHNVKIYSKDKSVAGRLVSYSDYDLELAIADSLPEQCSWCKQAKSSVFIDREFILYACEEDIDNGGTC